MLSLSTLFTPCSSIVTPQALLVGFLEEAPAATCSWEGTASGLNSYVWDLAYQHSSLLLTPLISRTLHFPGPSNPGL